VIGNHTNRALKKVRHNKPDFFIIKLSLKLKEFPGKNKDPSVKLRASQENYPKSYGIS